jgi:hypothetical protein
MRKLFLALAVAAFAAPALAQPVTQNNVSGQECWNAGQGPGGPGSFLCINLVRNGTALQTFSGAGAQTFTATQANSTLYWTGTAPTTWTITLPSPAFDGEIVSVATNTTLTTLVTVNAGAGQTLDGTFNAQTIAANTSVEFQFNFAGLKWYRLR